MASAQAIVKRRWSNLSAMADETRRPTVSPAQYSDRARVAVVSGAGSRKRTSQFETPTSDATYVAMAIPSSSSGPASSGRGRRDRADRRPAGACPHPRPTAARWASGTMAYATASSDDDRARGDGDGLPRDAALHERPDDERRGEGPDAERHVEQVHRPAAALAVHVEDEAVRAAVQASGPGAGRHRGQQECRPRRGQAETGDARDRGGARRRPGRGGDRGARSGDRRRTTRPRRRGRRRGRRCRSPRRSGRRSPRSSG